MPEFLEPKSYHIIDDVKTMLCIREHGHRISPLGMGIEGRDAARCGPNVGQQTALEYHPSQSNSVTISVGVAFSFVIHGDLLHSLGATLRENACAICTHTVANMGH